MNQIIEEEFEGQFPGIAFLRDQLMNVLSDEDLAYRLPGQNPPLGDLCAELGYLQQVYINSFKTFQQQWEYREPQPGAPTSVADLKAWYKTLDAKLYQALSAFSNDDLRTQQIDRGQGFTPPVFVQFQIFHEAYLIFYAKVSVYLKALEKRVSEEWDIGIG